MIRSAAARGTNDDGEVLFGFGETLTVEQWANIGVTAFAWLVVPLLVGLRLVMRAEVK